MDRLDAMQAFVRVVEAGTFTKAADSMGLPKAAVTRLIRSLEDHLQTRLLNRTTRKVSVTAEGSSYYERVTRLLAEVDELEGAMSQTRANPRGRIRVDVSPPIARLIVVPALPAFHRQYPDIQMDLGVTDRNADLMGDGIDCAIRVGEIRDQFLVARRIADLPFITCAAPGYLQQRGVPVHPRELEGNGHTIIGYFSALTGERWTLRCHRDGELVELQGRSIVSVNDGDTCVAAGLAGLGVVHALGFMVKAHIEAGQLVPLFEQWTMPSLPASIVYPPTRHVGTKLRVFVDWVSDLFARRRSELRRDPPLGQQGEELFVGRYPRKRRTR
jgi:LysR family transcriptional regulator, regulator for bpeEF and oprC